MKNIKKLAYELYKINWKDCHMITPQIEMDNLMDYYEGLADSDFNGEYTYEMYLEDFGYNGELYVSFDEFATNEFYDTEIMVKLLYNTELWDEYLKAREEI